MKSFILRSPVSFFAKAIRRYSVAIRRYSVAMELRRIAMVSYAKATEYPINNPFRSPKGEGWELRRIASEGSPFAKSPPMEQAGYSAKENKKSPHTKFWCGGHRWAFVFKLETFYFLIIFF